MVQGTNCYGVVKKTYEQHKKIYTWLSYNQLQYHVKMLKKLLSVTKDPSKELNAEQEGKDPSHSPFDLVFNEQPSIVDSTSTIESTVVTSSNSKRERPKGTNAEIEKKSKQN